MDTLNKLRWRCRRGTLELDLLLVDYLDKYYPAASVAEQQAFLQLLALEDAALQAYLLGDAAPGDETSASVVRKIRR
ncbi:MAG: succinate dehydrogenase assembly factor 2 [Methylococcales bacterium]|nr:succinate dehydrogenase assembly factor 2 [Methylococcales bacterium]